MQHYEGESKEFVAIKPDLEEEEDNRSCTSITSESGGYCLVTSWFITLLYLATCISLLLRVHLFKFTGVTKSPYM